MFYKNKELISIIVPVYNVEKYLEQCVEILKQQTYNNIEIILVDDGSTDSSGTLCDKIALTDRRIYVIHKKNGGLSDARNVGIQYSHGRYITCVDSDDLISNDYIDILYNAIHKFKADIAIGKIIGVFNKYDEERFKNNMVKSFEMNVLTMKEAMRTMLLQNDFDVSACAKLYKREHFEFAKYPVGKLYEDLATTYKIIAKCHKIAFCDKIIYGYRQNREGSITSEPFNLKRMELIESYRGFYTFIRKSLPKLRNEAECRLAACSTSILESIFLSEDRNNYPQLITSLKQTIRKRFPYIIKQKNLIFRRKVKMICAGIGRLPYMTLYLLYYHKK